MKHRVWAFFLLTFAITWGLQLPGTLVALGALPGPVERFLPLMGLGAFGPLIAATVMVSLEDGARGRRALFGRFRLWNVGAHWYVIALSVSGALYLASRAIHGLFGGTGPWGYIPHEAPTLVAMVVFPLGEEVGWRGYALPRLLPRYGALGASLILGVIWCFWHALMMVVSGVPLWMLAAMVPFFAAGSVVFTWIFRHTRGSLLLAFLTHVGAHLNNSNKAMPESFTPVALHTVAFVLFAAGVWWFDRSMREPVIPESTQASIRS